MSKITFSDGTSVPGTSLPDAGAAKAGSKKTGRGAGRKTRPSIETVQTRATRGVKRKSSSTDAGEPPLSPKAKLAASKVHQATQAQDQLQINNPEAQSLRSLGNVSPSDAADKQIANLKSGPVFPAPDAVAATPAAGKAFAVHAKQTVALLTQALPLLTAIHNRQAAARGEATLATVPTPPAPTPANAPAAAPASAVTPTAVHELTDVSPEQVTQYYFAPLIDATGLHMTQSEISHNLSAFFRLFASFNFKEYLKMQQEEAKIRAQQGALSMQTKDVSIGLQELNYEQEVFQANQDVGSAATSLIEAGRAGAVQTLGDVKATVPPNLFKLDNISDMPGHHPGITDQDRTHFINTLRGLPPPAVPPGANPKHTPTGSVQNVAAIAGSANCERRILTQKEQEALPEADKQAYRGMVERRVLDCKRNMASMAGLYAQEERVLRSDSKNQRAAGDAAQKNGQPELAQRHYDAADLANERANELRDTDPDAATWRNAMSRIATQIGGDDEQYYDMTLQYGFVNGRAQQVDYELQQLKASIPAASDPGALAEHDFKVKHYEQIRLDLRVRSEQIGQILATHTTGDSNAYRAKPVDKSTIDDRYGKWQPEVLEHGGVTDQGRVNGYHETYGTFKNAEAELTQMGDIGSLRDEARALKTQKQQANAAGQSMSSADETRYSALRGKLDAYVQAKARLESISSAMPPHVWAPIRLSQMRGEAQEHLKTTLGRDPTQAELGTEVDARLQGETRMTAYANAMDNHTSGVLKRAKTAATQTPNAQTQAALDTAQADHDFWKDKFAADAKPKPDGIKGTIPGQQGVQLTKQKAGNPWGSKLRDGPVTWVGNAVKGAAGDARDFATGLVGKRNVAVMKDVNRSTPVTARVGGEDVDFTDSDEADAYLSGKNDGFMEVAGSYKNDFLKFGRSAVQSLNSLQLGQLISNVSQTLSNQANSLVAGLAQQNRSANSALDQQAFQAVRQLADALMFHALQAGQG